MRIFRFGWCFYIVAVHFALINPVGLRADDSSHEINLPSLLNEMVDRDEMARWPVPAYALKEATSHDRSKTDPSNQGTWHSNNDHEQFIRTETNEGRKEWVIMEDHGPGAITRFWVPLGLDKAAQIIRFYFDGATTPSLSLNYLDFLSGKGFVRPPFAFASWNENDLRDELKPGYDPLKVSAQNGPGIGGDLFLPIAFAKSCKITLDSVPFYYGIAYRIYDPGTVVKTFSMNEYNASKSTLDRVGELLFNDTQDRSPSAELTRTATLAPNQTVTLELPGGENAVRALEVQIDPKDAPQVLRSMILKGTFDGESSIWCPLGDFFGTGVRLHPVHDWERTAQTDGTLTARWVMPYRHAGQLSLQNVGTTPVKVTLSAAAAPWRWDDRSMIFHADWHSQHALNTRPMSDWNYLQAQGKGVYVGDTLTVFSPASAWYGEGDERIYTDGEKLPSMIGTGTEDYYGYAWGMPGFFSSPFMSNPQRDTISRDDWTGYTTDSRIRLLDGIPFRSQLKFDMEIWDWTDTQLDYAVGLFWYALPGASSNRQINEARLPLKEKPVNPGQVNVAGAIECESVPRTLSPGTVAEVQGAGLPQGSWSSGQQLLVRATKVGDFVELEIPVPDDKTHKVTFYGTKAPDYGILHFTVNGESAGPDFDGYSAAVHVSGPIELGTFRSQDGKMRLRAKVVGTNSASNGAYFYMGLDCVGLDSNL